MLLEKVIKKLNFEIKNVLERLVTVQVEPYHAPNLVEHLTIR